MGKGYIHHGEGAHTSWGRGTYVMFQVITLNVLLIICKTCEGKHDLFINVDQQ